MRSSTSLTLLLASLATAREVPSNLKSFYDAHKSSDCPNAISIPYSSGQANADTVYCKDNASSAIYLKDTSGGYADVDIDCDGAGMGTGDCGDDQSGQSQTAFKDLVQEYSNNAIDDLNTHIHTFVVLGNDNSPDEGDGGAPFDPTADAGIEPLSVVAVVCGEKLVYGVWGDVNGGKVTGETSISLAKMCFPDEDISGNSGHSEHDVLYLAFPGEGAVPKDSAVWGAASAEEFEASLAEVGDRLVQEIGEGGAPSFTSRVVRRRV
ncbi:glycoside hydrolase family 75 protein [Trematosphaeria pertusa]|uniref:Endo-chitosanase n=1 Tax=Trematosphaeria pertusa TaxID=390896 RepID=A0A6A6ILA3_9PLEO|nr:glycoside hydrolase family 75 protein [Trematosphaeria pertusa]KAF2250989.1 glycoside hydrolase family 75 protein [Trematosphaeria pertusa]